ncbi:MAG: solute carrier family 23 protein, partial [Coriobacteriia bacterium]|nr:solute carrier family 23 protein [Coriobacteriia bacterium]
MAFLKREYGGIQPSIPVAMLRIRIPFVHFKISPPEIVTGLMNACTSYGALAVLTGTLGLDPYIAWSLVVFETLMYSCNWLLGEPSICGWITPAMALVVVYLEGFADPGYAAAVAALGEEAVTAAGGGMQALLQSGNQEYIQIAHNTTTLRMQAMAATELELGILFIVLGVTGLSKALNTLVPPGIKAGIVLGAGVGAVRARLLEGGAMDTATWGCLGGLIIVFLLMFSLRVRNKMDDNRFLQILGNYSFLWAVLGMFIIGGIAGEFDFSGILD